MPAVLTALLLGCGSLPPVIDAEPLRTLEEDASALVGIIGLAGDGSDRPVTVRITEPPAHGSLDGAEGVSPYDVRYTSDPDFFGVDGFAYALVDRKRETLGRITLVVTPLPDPPVASDDAFTTSDLAPIDLDVLANDLDPDGEPIALMEWTAPASG